MVVLTPSLSPSAGFCECVGHSGCDVHLGPVFYAGLGTLSPQTFQPGPTGAPQRKVHEGPRLLANERGWYIDQMYFNYRPRKHTRSQGNKWEFYKLNITPTKNEPQTRYIPVLSSTALHTCLFAHQIFFIPTSEYIDLLHGVKHQSINCNLPFVPGFPEGGFQTVHSGHPDGLDPPGAWEGFVRNTLPEQTKAKVSVFLLTDIYT